MSGFVVLLTDFGKSTDSLVFHRLKSLSVMLVPLAYTIVSLHYGKFIAAANLRTPDGMKGVRYHITNPALIGACFLPCGLGNISESSPSINTVYH